MMWNVLGLQMTPYAWSVWIGCVLALAVFLLEGKRRKVKPAALACTAGLGIVLGLLCARLFYVLARLELFLDIGLENFFRAADEDLMSWGSAKGAAFWGAAGGVSLAALLSGKITKERVSALLDALAPAAALAIAVSRFGEYSIGEGIGPEVESESLQFFPLAVMNEWEEWNYALFLLEGLAGLVIFVLLITRGRGLKDGYRARMFLILYSSSQIVLEALRRDNFLRWLFVRVSQVTCAVVLLGLIVAAIVRRFRSPDGAGRSAGRLIGKTLLNLLVLLLCIYALQLIYWGLFIGTPLELNSALWWSLICSGWPTALAALVLLAVVCMLRKPEKIWMQEKQEAFPLAVFVLSAVIIVALEFGVDKSPDLSVAVAYLLEALCCVLMGVTGWHLVMRQ